MSEASASGANAITRLVTEKGIGKGGPHARPRERNQGDGSSRHVQRGREQRPLAGRQNRVRCLSFSLASVLQPNWRLSPGVLSAGSKAPGRQSRRTTFRRRHRERLRILGAERKPSRAGVFGSQRSFGAALVKLPIREQPRQAKQAARGAPVAGP